MRALRGAALGLALGLGLASAAPAQTPQQGGVRVLNQDRLLRDSALGRAVLEELRAAEVALERENQALVEQLSAEERALTELRPTLSLEEFRARAEAFDRRVEAVRAERARLSRELGLRYEAEAQRFFATALPVLTDLMAEQGIVAILSPEAVILGADWLDITEQVIERLDRSTAAPSGAP